ncbi:TrkA family potassium uptake protein [halophilic archaeon]|nr:TrkA family potassium uptake protein [halophilic archaeon]
MYIIVVGAGRTGSRFIELSTCDEHEVVVIEQDEERAREISTQYDCLVINEDGASHSVLEEADIEHADALVATTLDDATNLLVMMHGQDAGVASLVSSVNDEGNRRLFRELDVNTVESPHRLNGEYLYRTVQRPGIRDFMELPNGAEIFEMTVDETAPIVGKTLIEAYKENLLADQTIIVAIDRDNELLIPDEETRIELGDLVTVFSRTGATKEATRPFNREGIE